MVVYGLSAVIQVTNIARKWQSVLNYQVRILDLMDS